MEKIQEKISLVTADGTPLKISLARAQRRSKTIAFMMVFPLLFFVTIAFIVPIADMLLFSIDNSIVKKTGHLRLFSSIALLQKDLQLRPERRLRGFRGERRRRSR